MLARNCRKVQYACSEVEPELLKSATCFSQMPKMAPEFLARQAAAGTCTANAGPHLRGRPQPADAQDGAAPVRARPAAAPGCAPQPLHSYGRPAIDMHAELSLLGRPLYAHAPRGSAPTVPPSFHMDLHVKPPYSRAQPALACTGPPSPHMHTREVLFEKC